MRLSALTVAASVVVAASASPASAAVYTAGLGGAYATIEAALAAAFAAGGINEVRVRTGTYHERLTIELSAGTLEVSGGWDAAFANRDPDPALTTIDAQQAHRTLDVHTQGDAAFTVRGFTITGGQVSDNGGGVRAIGEGSSMVTVDHVRIVDNVASAASVQGGGISAELHGDSHLAFTDSEVSGNRAVGVTYAQGGGGDFIARDDAHLTVDRNEFSDNRAESTDYTVAGGLQVNTQHRSVAEVLDNLIQGNTAVFGADAYSVSGLGLSAGGSGLTMSHLTARRNRVVDNVLQGGVPGLHVSLFTNISGELELTDSLVAGGNGRGLRAIAANSADVVPAIQITNVTVADHPGAGLEIEKISAGAISVFNTILYDNGPSDLSDAITGFNLIDTDPLFVDPLDRDYRLLDGSPALDAGTNAPPGGLGAMDLGGGPRVIGDTVDVGAYEGPTEVTGCVRDATTLCLNKKRFAVRATWRTMDNDRGDGMVVDAGTADTGLFYFFGEENWELLVKVLDACELPGFGNHWVFAAAATDVEFTITVTDTENDEEQSYFHPFGRQPPVTDTDHFQRCP